MQPEATPLLLAPAGRGVGQAALLEADQAGCFCAEGKRASTWGHTEGVAL